MRILYGIQLNGNGHITRSSEIIKELRRLGNKVDILTSGNNSSLKIESKYNFRGFSLFNGTKGKINWLKTILNIRILRIIRDVRGLDLSNYDLVISDFEPITALSARIKGIKSLSISNQNSLLYSKLGFFQKFFIKNFSKCDYNIGIDYIKDENNIQPIIQSDLLNKKISNNGSYVIYLPSIDIDYIISEISKVDSKFIIYSTDSVSSKENILIKKIDRVEFIKDLLSCNGIITASGFSTTSESLVLGKKLWSIPIKGQIEQKINSDKLKTIGVFTGDFNHLNLQKWITEYDVVEYDWVNPINELLEKIKKIYEG